MTDIRMSSTEGFEDLAKLCFSKFRKKYRLEICDLRKIEFPKLKGQKERQIESINEWMK